VPCGHSEHSGTASHARAGTQAPVQHTPEIPGSVPGGQSGGAWSQATSPLHWTFSVAQTPNLHTAFLIPIESHIGWSQSFSHGGAGSSFDSPKQSQQSLWS